MRLVCPNCDAKYEVPEDAIPESGRDVQCANCGHAWYQMRPRTAGVASETAPAGAAASARDADVSETSAVEVVSSAEPEAPVAAPSDEQSVAVEDTVSAPDSVTAEPVEDVPAVVAVGAIPAVEASVVEALVADETDDTGAGQPAIDPIAATAAPAAYAVDESVLAILREEAERETKARRADASKPLETQTELGIEAAMPAAKKPVEAFAPAVDNDHTDPNANRRTRLPDVEEINSTLRPAESGLDDIGDAGARPSGSEGRSSFRSGFLLVLTLAIIGSALYGSADALAEAVPALSGPLKAFVGLVDSLRLGLDGLMQSATAAINGN